MTKRNAVEAFDPLVPFRASVDPVLRSVLHGKGISDRMIACLWRDVNADDMRSVRRIAALCGGPVSVMDSVMGATIPIAPGVHWNGGSLRIAPDAHAMPQTVLETLTGRPLRDLVDHPLLPDVRIVGHDEDDLKFWANGIPTTEHGAVVHTDAQPFVLPEPGPARMAHTVLRAWHDRHASWQQIMRVQKRIFVTTIPVVAILYGIMFALGILHPSSFSFPIAAGGIIFGWSVAIAILMITGSATKERWGPAHQQFMIKMWEQQREQGFIGPDE